MCAICAHPIILFAHINPIASHTDDTVNTKATPTFILISITLATFAGLAQKARTNASGNNRHSHGESL
jgi:hypothetical protein